MTRRTEEERLAELDQRMEQLKAKKQRLQSQVSQKERKARTRRLIQIGAIFEQYFGVQINEQMATDVIKTLHQLANKEEQQATTETERNTK